MTRREKRRRFSQWILDLIVPRTGEVRHRKILVEPLEVRELMASDLMALLGSSYTPPLEDTSFSSEVSVTNAATSSSLVAEGEDANNLVGFAKALADSGTRFFGAAWCTFCNQQKALFEDGAKFLPFIEVTNPDRTANQIAIDENITQYPTWEFPDGTRAVGLQTLATLAQRSGVAIPQSSRPSFATLPDVNVMLGSPLMIPIDAYDPNGNPLTITVTSSNSSVVSARVLTGNPSWKLSTNYGDMVFQLFEDKAARPVGRVVSLTNSGFYNGIDFHRVINNFVIQGGDPTGTGAGGSTLGDFDDQFHLDLQHNSTGVLSFAKETTDDTNDSQFFITEGPQRHLDFNHSVFGRLVEGETNREAISNTSVNGSNKPANAITINTATTFNDTENGIIQLTAAAASGTATISVTVTDTEGNSTSQSFVVTAIQDTANGAPFLSDIPTIRTSVNTPVNLTLASQDGENDTRVYAVQKVGTQDFTVTVNSASGVVTVTPPTGFTGQLQFKAIVSQSTTATTQSATDEQLVTVLVGPSAASGIDLDSASDSGASSTDNLTNGSSLSFIVSGTIPGATVLLKAGETTVGQASATGTTTTVNVTNTSLLGQGSVSLVAVQVVEGQAGEASPNLTIVYDTVSPQAIANGTFPTTVQAGQVFSLDLSHAEEGQGLVYALSGAPSGMTIGSSNGQISWTPTEAQTGTQTFTLNLTDGAGNVTPQTVSIGVVSQPQIAITLQTVDLNGSPITTVASSGTFKVQVFVQDLRTNPTGVFSAYADLLYDASKITPIATNPISHGTVYVNGIAGDTNTAGLINELGGFGPTSRLDGTSRLLAEVTFVASGAGSANLRLESPDDNGNDFTLFDQSSKVPFSKVNFGSSSFAVGVNFTAVNDVFNFDEDSGLRNLNVLSNDTTSGSGVTLAVSGVGTPSNGGIVTIASDGKSINYTPAANYNGAETFTYIAKNSQGVELTATVTVQLTDVNDPPVANNDSFTASAGSSNNVFNVLTNDTRGADSASSETLRVTSVGTPSQNGTVTIGSSGLTLNYTPRATFNGTETFTYTLSDGRGGTSVATVTVAVGNVSPPPTAQNDTFTVVEDANIASFDLLANDTPNAAGDVLRIASVSSSNRGSTINVRENGTSINYKPSANLAGTEIFTYVLQDNKGGQTTGTVTFNVTAVNDAPTGVNDEFRVQSTTGTSNLDVLSNDTNVDTGESLTITTVTQPPSGKGTLAISSDGKSLTYTPPTSTFEGNFEFTYTFKDSGGLTATATAKVEANSFTPALVTGTININGGNAPIGGVSLVLAGTDKLGQTVSKRALANPSGNYELGNIVPGNYTLTPEKLDFFTAVSDTLQFNVLDQSTGDVALNQISVGGLLPQYFDIRDFLGSRPKSSLTVALNPDGTQQWFASRGEWGNLSAVTVQASTAGDVLTINTVDKSQQAKTGTVALSNTAQVTQLGQSSSMRLVRIQGTPSALTATAGTNTGFTRTASGLQHKITKPGNAVKPNATSSVTVNYEGKLDNGTVFDSSFTRGTPSTFRLNQVIAGWTEGLQLIGEGGSIELIIPPALGYGAAGSGTSIPPNATLNFKIDLISVNNNTASGEGEAGSDELDSLLSPLFVDQVMSQSDSV